MADPLLLLSARLQTGFDAFEPGADPVLRVSDHADYQANGALPLAKRLGRNPRELAAEIVERSELADLAAVELAGPGFINLMLHDDAIAHQAISIARSPTLGLRAASAPERVVVDYSAPNVAKEMHVGHLRSTVIGDALVRTLESVGHTVVRENHIGDWGLAFGMLIEHLLDLGEAHAAAELSAGDLTAFYREARVKFDGSDAYKERSRERVVALQSGDPETLRLWHVLVSESTAYFRQVYDVLGVRLQPADIVGESFYNAMLSGVVDDLEAAGLLVESGGALCTFPPGFLGREGEPQPLIVKNRNGGYGYAATDLATVRDRVDRLQATWLVYVIGAPQAQHLQMVWATAAEAGWLRPPARCVHVAFGSILGEDRKIYRSRSGASIRLADLLDEAIARADVAVAERSPEITGDERRAVARAVGIGAVKYADLANDRVKDYVFSWDRMLSFDGNTAPYLQYAHARIRSILRNAESEPDAEAMRLGHPQERALALALLGYDAAVWDTIDKLAPHRLCTYLFDLAQTFTAFYDACPVLRGDVEPEARDSRLVLCALTARVLAHGLDLLGITAPERM